MRISKRKLRMLVVHIIYAACGIAHIAPTAGGFPHAARNAHVIPQDARDSIKPRRNRSAFP